MRIDFLGLHAFVAIAERGSFQMAAAHLNLSQTALSHRIRKLEDNLGVKLLSRTTREVSLTSAGLGLLPRVRALIDEMGASLDAIRGLGKVRQERLAIACLPTIAAGLMPSILPAFRKDHPDVMLRIHDNAATEIAELVENGTVEFAVTLVSAHRWDFNIQTLARDPFVLICHRDSPLGPGASVTWADIDEQPLVRISTHTGNRMMIDDALGSRRETLNWRYEVQHIASASGVVRSGVAMAVVPRMALSSSEMTGLRVKELRNPSVTRQIGIVSKRAVPLSAIATDLRKLVVRELTARNRALGARKTG